MKIQELNLEKLGSLLLNVAPGSIHANHKWIKSTVKDYVLPTEGQVELDFIRDLFTLDNKDIADKWYNGEQGAIDFILNR